MRLTIPISEMSVDYGDSDAFGVDNKSLDYTPSRTHSFSSSSSSSFGAYTPTSRRSTPRTRSDAMDLSSSFTSSASSFGPYTPTSERSTPPTTDLSGLAYGSSIDSFSFNLTPPSSALSAYFQVGVKTEPGYDMFQSHDPSAQSHSQPELPGLPFGQYTEQLTPSHAVSFYQFANELGQSPLQPSPLAPIQPSPSWDNCSIWAQVPDSPISFEKHKVTLPSLTDLNDQGETLAFITGHIGRRLFKVDKEQKSNKLNPITSRKRAKGAKNLNTIVTKDGLQISKVGGRNFKCAWEGCPNRYERKEHLKRHVES